MTQKNLRKILYVLIAIVVVILIYLTISYIKNYQKPTSGKDNNDIPGETAKIYEEPRYGFKYTVPKDLTYETFDEYYFKISSKDGWYALATIEPMAINNHKPIDEIYNEYIANLNKEEEIVYKESYSDIEIVGYQKINNKQIDYQMVTPWEYCYRIVVFYETDEFSFESLNDVIYSLLTPDYDTDND